MIDSFNLTAFFTIFFPWKRIEHTLMKGTYFLFVLKIDLISLEIKLLAFQSETWKKDGKRWKRTKKITKNEKHGKGKKWEKN